MTTATPATISAELARICRTMDTGPEQDAALYSVLYGSAATIGEAMQAAGTVKPEACSAEAIRASLERARGEGLIHKAAVRLRVIIDGAPRR